MSSAVISASVPWLDGQRNARGVIGHHVRTFADGGRGLDLGVEGHAPVERRRLDLDRVLVLVVEVLDELLHADAVAAAEEVPPDHRLLGLRADGERERAPPSPVLSQNALHLVFLHLFRFRQRSCETVAFDGNRADRATVASLPRIQIASRSMDCRRRAAWRRLQPYPRPSAFGTRDPLAPKNGCTRSLRASLGTTIHSTR